MSSSRLWPRLRIWEKSRDGPHPLWKAVASVRAIWSGASPRSLLGPLGAASWPLSTLASLGGGGQGRPALPGLGPWPAVIAGSSIVHALWLTRWGCDDTACRSFSPGLLLFHGCISRSIQLSTCWNWGHSAAICLSGRAMLSITK